MGGYDSGYGGRKSDFCWRSFVGHYRHYGRIMESLTDLPHAIIYITFADRRGMEDAIREMDDKELGERVILVDKAQPKFGFDYYGEEDDHIFICGLSRNITDSQLENAFSHYGRVF